MKLRSSEADTLPETARLVTEHESWCVRDHARGSCSDKRGHWDRSTNTWDSDLTQKDRSAIADGLLLWRSGKNTRQEAAEYIRKHSDNLTAILDTALLTWNMTQRKYEKKGKSWPI